MLIPVVTGTGERFMLDSDDYPRMVLAEVCADVDPRAWELFTDEPGGRHERHVVSHAPRDPAV